MPRFNYRLTFLGRKRGAIGIFYNVELCILAGTPLSDDQLLSRAYDTHEHILAFRIDGRPYNWRTLSD